MGLVQVVSGGIQLRFAPKARLRTQRSVVGVCSCKALPESFAARQHVQRRAVLNSGVLFAASLIANSSFASPVSDKVSSETHCSCL